MRKLLFIGWLSVFLTWCSINTKVTQLTENTWNVHQIQTSTQEIKTFWIVEEGIYSSHIANFSWCISLNEQEATKENKTTWINAWLWAMFYKCQKIIGYNHIYTIPELWVKITYDKDYDQWLDMFLQKDFPSFLSTNENSVYESKNPDIFIQLAYKDAKQTPEQVIKMVNTAPNCKYTLNSVLSQKTNNSGMLIYDSTCTNGTWLSTRYIFNKNKKGYFYIQTYVDACAPNPCDVFDTKTIEYFLK